MSEKYYSCECNECKASNKPIACVTSTNTTGQFAVYREESFELLRLRAENAKLRECADILDKLRGMWILSGWAADRCITALRACGYDQPDKPK